MVKTHILIELIKYIRVHDDTTADEKYQFICMIDFRRVFRDGANVERINFRGGIVGNVKINKRNAGDSVCSLDKMVSLMIAYLTENSEHKGWKNLVCLLINQHLRSLSRIVVNTHHFMRYNVNINIDPKGIVTHRNVDIDAMISCLCRMVHVQLGVWNDLGALSHVWHDLEVLRDV